MVDGYAPPFRKFVLESPLNPTHTPNTNRIWRKSYKRKVNAFANYLECIFHPKPREVWEPNLHPFLFFMLLDEITVDTEGEITE